MLDAFNLFRLLADRHRLFTDQPRFLADWFRLLADRHRLFADQPRFLADPTSSSGRPYFVFWPTRRYRRTSSKVRIYNDLGEINVSS